MFRGMTISQTRLIAALILGVFAGFLVAHWQGQSTSAPPAQLAGPFTQHPRGQLASPSSHASPSASTSASTFASPAASATQAAASPQQLTAPPDPQLQPVSAAPPRGLINVNTATAQELDMLPGIGPAKSAAILQEREARGPFRTPADLLRVSGIGEKTLAKLAPLITLGEEAAMPAAMPGGSAAMAAPSGPAPVFINRAGAEELQRLKYIGPALSQRILQDRAARGPFRSTQDLLRVRGIGPRTIEENRHLLRFD